MKHDWSWDTYCRFSLVETRTTHSYNRWDLSSHIQSVRRQWGGAMAGSKYEESLNREEQGLIQVVKHGHFEDRRDK